MVPNIYIKSFNRPYYLERCIRSVQKFVRGNYNLVIMDDGTPQEYLEKIKTRLPEIQIRTSPLYKNKVEAIHRHVPGDAFPTLEVPSSFWYETIANGSSIFLLLEEDAWLTDTVDIDHITSIITRHRLSTVKISWNGAPAFVDGRKIQLSTTIEELVPSVAHVPLPFLKLYLTNSFKIRSVLTRTGFVDTRSLMPYYQLYTVTSAFFEKKYWLYLWDGAKDKINEGYQLYRAAKWLQKTNARYGTTVTEKVKTSFITASTNRFKTTNFDMVQLHHQLNKAWLDEKLNPLQNFPRDFSTEYLKSFLSANFPEAASDKWDQWIHQFKTMYRQIGCDVDS